MTIGGVVAGGSGGSAMGGAIFVRSGGALTITGNATFDNNQLIEGAGQAGVAGSVMDGAYGSAAGTDLFMMKGSTVTLNPGLGNTIEFNGDIADDSSASGISSFIPSGLGAGLSVTSGRVIFNGTNTYTGQTKITGGVLQADDTVGINAKSNINFAGSALAGGVLQSNGSMPLAYKGEPDAFSRYVGTGATGVQWTGSGGFAAADSATAGPLTVKLNNGSKSLTWGQGGFIANGNALIFGSDTAADSVIFTNAMNLNTGSGTILVVANGNSLKAGKKNVSDTATFSGVISNGSLIVGNPEHTGIAIFTAANTYAGGTTINGGTLALADGVDANGAVINGALNANGAVTVNAGVLDLSNPGAKAIGTLSGAGTVSLGANMLTINQAADSTFSGVVQDGGLTAGTGAALTKAGAGNLTLSGANTYTGATQIDAGTLTLAGAGSLASNVVGVAAGATLTDNNSGLTATAALTNAGTVNFGADDTIATLVNTGTINGVGTTLTAATYALDNGSVINANLGAGVMTSNGAVALNGTSAAATVDIASGTTTLGSAGRLLTTSAVTTTGNLVLGGNEQIGQLFGTGNVDLTAGGLTVDSGNFAGVLQSNNATFGLTKVSAGVLTLSGVNTYTGATQINAGMLSLTGSMASNTVNVAAGSTLDNLSGGLAATAVLTNDGTVNMGANNTIATLVNTGTINGAGTTLTAATYALNNGSVINANLGTGTVTTSGIVTLNGTSNAANIIIPLNSTLNLGGAGPLLINPLVAVAADGIMNLVGGNESIQTLSGAGVINLNVNQLNVVNGGLFTGTINGATAQLNSNGGVLNLTNGATATLATNVASGSTINVTGTSTVSTQNATVATGGTLNIGTGGTFSATTVGGGTGNINLVNNSNLVLAPGALLNYTLLNGGTIASAGGTVNSADFTNQFGSAVQGFLTFTGNFTNNGTLAPGNSPGLTTIAGNYTENAILEAQIQDTTPISGYDQVRVGGTVTLNPSSTLVVHTWGGVLPASGNVYQIITDSAGAPVRVNGAFGNVLFDANGQLTPVNPISNAAAVFDVNTGKMITTGLNAANSTFADLGSTPSQRGAMTALMSAAMSGVGKNQLDSQTSAGSTALALLSTNGSTASASLARLVPEQYGGMANFSFLTSRAVSDFLFVRSAPMGKSSGLSGGDSIDNKSIYVGYMNNKDNTASNNVNRNDFYVGAEGGSDKFTLGVLAMNSTGNISSTYGGGTVGGQGANIYARSVLSPVVSILGSVGYSSQNYNLNRAAITGTASATTSGHGVNATLGATYLAYDRDNLSILPRLGLGYAETSVGGFQETGSVQRLNVSGYKASRLSVQAGVLFASNTQVSGRALKLGLSLGMDSAIADKGGVMNATMAIDPRIQFPISTAGGNKTNGTLGLSANYEVLKDTSMYAKYELNGAGRNAKLEFSKRF